MARASGYAAGAMSTRRGHFWARVAAAAVIAAICAGLAASAGAFVDIYTNNFSNKAQYHEIESVSGSNLCKREFKEKKGTMLITVEQGPKGCTFKPPVQGNSPKPDHRFDAHGRILKSTPNKIRGDAYLSLAVRVGGGRRYELRVFPKGRDFALRRTPDNAVFPAKGSDGAIKHAGKLNKLRIVVVGSEIRAVANGKELADVTDPNAGDVRGTKLEFGVGSERHTKKDTVGNFDRLKVSVPDP